MKRMENGDYAISMLTLIKMVREAGYQLGTGDFGLKESKDFVEGYITVSMYDEVRQATCTLQIALRSVTSDEHRQQLLEYVADQLGIQRISDQMRQVIITPKLGLTTRATKLFTVIEIRNGHFASQWDDQTANEVVVLIDNITHSKDGR